MSAHKDKLRLRREGLVAQAASQRSQLALMSTRIKKSLHWVDMGYAVGQTLRAHPVLAVAGVSVLFRMGRVGRLRWVGQVFTAWELFSLARKQWIQNRH